MTNTARYDSDGITSAPTAEPPCPPLLDYERLERLIADTDSDSMALIVATYFSSGEMAGYVRELEAGYQTAALDGVRRAAHTLKSGAELIGAVRLAEALANLEQAAKQNLPDSALPQVQACLALIQETRDHYRALGILPRENV